MHKTVFPSMCTSAIWILIVLMGIVQADDKLDAFMKKSKFKKAVEYIEKNITRDKRSVDVWLQYAEALEKSGGKKEHIIGAFEGAKKVQPSDPRIFAGMGNYYSRVKDYKNALKPLQKWYLLKRSAEAAEAMAVCAMNLKEYDIARDAAESAVRLDNSTVESRKILSFLYFNDKDWKTAAFQLEKVVTKIKDDVNYWKKLAFCYGELKNREKLVEAARQIVKLDAKDIKSRTIVSEYYLNKKDEDAAFPLLKELAVLTPENPDVFRNLYKISLAKKATKDAVLYLRNFLILDSTDASAYKTLGDLSYQEKKYDQARDAYRKALKLNPSIKGIYQPYMKILIEKKYEKEVLAVAPKAIKAGEIDAPMYVAVGNIYKKNKVYPKAIEFFQNALKTNMKNVSVLSSLAECQELNGQTSEALLNYQQVVMLNPNANIEYKHLGDLLTKKKKNGEAINNYKKYLMKSPDDEEVAKIVGLYYYNTKKYREALPFFEKVKSKKYLTASLMITIGDCYFKTGNFSKAVVSLSGARERKLSQSALKRVLAPLAEAYEKTGAMEDAAKTYEAYVKLPKVKDPDASYKQAFLREKSNQAKAIELYNDNIKKYPKDARNFTRLGILLTTDKKQAAVAVKMLEKAEKLVPNDTLVLQHLCNAYRAQGSSTKELATAVKLVSLQPKNIGMNQRAGAILFRKKQYAKAVPYLEMVYAAQPNKNETALMLAEAYMKIKKPAQAMKTYGSIHKAQPENVDILVSLIAASEAAGKKKEADDYRETLAALDKKNIAKDSTDVSGRLRLADYLYRKGDLKGAFPIYKELSVLKPNDRYVFSRLVDITQKNGKKKEALTYLKKFVTLDTKNAKARVDLGNLLYSQKKSDEALVEYRMALKLDSTQAGFLKNYGDIVIKKGLEDEALVVLPLAIKAKEADVDMYVTLGKIYKKRKRYASAIDVFKKASKMAPKNVGILVQLAECQALKKDVSGAVITYEQVVMLNPKAVDEFKALGDLQMQQKKVEEAIASYRKYLKKKKNDSKIARVVGMHLYNKKKYKEALAYLEGVTDKKFKTAEYLLALGDAYYLTKDCQKVCNVYSQLWTSKASKQILSKILRPLGECYQKIGNNDQAAEAFAAYVALPGINDAEAAYLRAFLAEKKDPKKAEAFYLANTKTFPKDGRNFLRLGIMYSEKKATLKKATVQLEKAASLDPKDIAILARLAKIWNSLKNSTRELEAYTKLLAQDPNNKEANVRAGKLLYDKKKYKDAVNCLQRAEKNNPNDMEIKLMLSEAYLKTGDRKNGVALLEKVNEVQKDNPELMVKLYTVYKEMGKNKESEKIIKRLITKQNDNKYRLLYAEDLIAQKRYDEAKFVSEKIVKEEPMNLEGLMLSGKALGFLKKYDEAIEAFKMVSYVKDDYAPAFYERAEMYRRQNNLERAEYFFNKTLGIDSKFARAHLGIARIRKAQGKMDEYKKLVEKAKALDPKDTEVIREEKHLQTSVAPEKKK